MLCRHGFRCPKLRISHASCIAISNIVISQREKKLTKRHVDFKDVRVYIPEVGSGVEGICMLLLDMSVEDVLLNTTGEDRLLGTINEGVSVDWSAEDVLLDTTGKDVLMDMSSEDVLLKVSTEDVLLDMLADSTKVG